jgi:hypothetical protein
MITKILGADAMQGVKDLQGLRAKQHKMLAQMRSRGIAVTEHVDVSPLVARIEHGRWIGDCSCGSGVNVHPDWPEARCMGCGAVYPNVVLPAQRDAVEQALVARPQMAARNWHPHETLDQLHAENLEHGIGRVR